MKLFFLSGALVAVAALAAAVPQATITWTPVTTDTSGATITIPVTYNVYRGNTSTTATTKVASPTASPYVDTNVKAGQAMCYTVTAQDANGESAKPPAICVTVSAVNVPAAPANVTAK